MKKLVLAILCAAMLILPFSLTVGAAQTTPNGAGSLAITEICPAPGNGAFEFIEIINTSESEVNLSDYYILRFGFSHSGRYAASGSVRYTVTTARRSSRNSPKFRCPEQT